MDKIGQYVIGIVLQTLDCIKVQQVIIETVDFSITGIRFDNGDTKLLISPKKGCI